MANTTRSERPRKRSSLSRHYSALLERQAQSGLSLSDFAASVGVPVGTLYRWRRRLAAGAERPSRPRVIEVSVVPSSPVAPVADPPGIAVDLRSGHRLDVRAGFDSGELRRLIGVLESC